MRIVQTPHAILLDARGAVYLQIAGPRARVRDPGTLLPRRLTETGRLAFLRAGPYYSLCSAHRRYRAAVCSPYSCLCTVLSDRTCSPA